ncbi:MAG TPA: DUF1501 domain-containing protein [Blastocatellia bacterium]|nr:DUF1501 domain-containing protein [Blastocatellia bacterium]HMZ18492.1 DUF1501 domain-containing protein [Blastocatellia bacterium]HNG30533.1 DUF1501 domain-containing protein [Blastocatellia bacterium]
MRNRDSSSNELRDATRRHFFGQCAIGIGSIALDCLLARDGVGAPQKPQIDPTNPMAARKPPQPAKAKRVIYLFMAGAPSQLELFSDKPKLRELTGQPPPPSLMKGKRFAFLKGNETLLGTKRKFAQYGQSGMTLSELLPHHRRIVDEVCWMRGMATDVFNHGPAKLFMNTGFQVPGRPAFGSWVTYGLGSESQDLPGFVVLQSGRRGPRGGATLWSSGFLPTSFQGVPFRGQGDAILNLRSPEGMGREQERDFYDTVGALNKARHAETGDPEILTRINAYEMAFRMQTSAPELMDLSKESAATLAMYGVKPGESGFAANALLARRMIERGVRFVQLYHTDWDHHGERGNNLDGDIEARCREVDQASAALVLDLKQRGLLEDTIVLWGGEFGRTPMGEVRETTGRDHHIEGFTMWAAGGGFKAGHLHGETDELGFGVTQDRLHVHDLHATILQLLGFDHERLTYRFQGRDYRLTDVHGLVQEKLLA